MSDDNCDPPLPRHNGSVGPRRRSLLYRITDTISSFLPTFFESKDETEPISSSSSHVSRETSGNNSETYVRPSQAVHGTEVRRPRVSNRLTVTRIDRIEIPESPPTLPPEIDVDLDAKDDKSECSTDSKASVSTSGVSSLLPRNSRNEGTSMRKNIFPRPPLSDYRHEYFSRRDSGSSKRPSCSTTELWSDLDTTKRPPSCASQPVRKRMRTDSSQSDLSSAFSSPFYRGRVSYGGASSLRGMTKPQSVFEHVAPLRFIIEAPEEGTPSKTPQPAPSATLSATAKRILESLEKHTFPIASSDKIPLPAPVPGTPLSRPLQRSTTRFPPYMAAYKRYRENRQNQQALPSVPSTSNSALPQPSFTYNQPEEQHAGGGVMRREKYTFPTPKPATPALPKLGFTKPPALPSSASEKQVSESLPVPKFDFSRLGTAKTVPITALPTSSPTCAQQTLTNSSTLPQSGISSVRRIQSSPTFTFSSPIALAPPVRPREQNLGAPLYTFSAPLPRLKRPAPVSNSSFLPTLLSPNESKDDIQPPTKRVTMPSDLSLWRCESCLTENSTRESMCKSCQLPKCTPEPQRLEKPLLSSTATSGWDCPTCMVKNKSDVDKCVCCQTANPKKSDVQGNNGGASVSFNGRQGENNTWKCPSCLVPNKGDAMTCICCSTKRSLSKAGSTPTFNFGTSNAVTGAGSPSTASGFSFGTQPKQSGFSLASTLSTSPLTASDKKWECPTCMVKNGDSLDACPCCQTKKPGSKNSSNQGSLTFGTSNESSGGFKFGGSSDKTGSSGFKFGGSSSLSATPSSGIKFGGSSSSGSGFKLGSTEKPSTFSFGNSSAKSVSLPAQSSSSGAKWECPTCMVKNDDTVDTCPCCQTKRPAAKPNASLSSSGSKWDCPTCMVKNDDSVSICPCCQTKKPASLPKSAQSNTSDKWECPTCMVKNSTSASACPCCQTKKPNDILGTPKAPSVSTFATPTSQGFDSPPVIISAVKPSFNFGAQNAKLNTSASTFSFGTPIAKSTAPSLSTSTSVPAFNFSKPATSSMSASSSGFTLGYKPASFAPPVKPTAAATLKNGGNGFQFGSPATPTFNFGSTKENVTPSGNNSASASNAINSNSTSNSSGGGFSFQPPAAAIASDGNVATSAPSQVFKFGEPASAASSSGLFNFSASGASSQPGPSMFSATSTPAQRSGIHGRPIRRAVRRQPRN